MELRDKKEWLGRYGYTQFKFEVDGGSAYTVQWRVFGKAFMYTGKGETEDEAYDYLYEVVKETLYNICDLNGHL